MRLNQQLSQLSNLLCVWAMSWAGSGIQLISVPRAELAHLSYNDQVSRLKDFLQVSAMSWASSGILVNMKLSWVSSISYWTYHIIISYQHLLQSWTTMWAGSIEFNLDQQRLSFVSLAALGAWLQAPQHAKDSQGHHNMYMYMLWYMLWWL